MEGNERFCRVGRPARAAGDGAPRAGGAGRVVPHVASRHQGPPRLPPRPPQSTPSTWRGRPGRSCRSIPRSIPTSQHGGHPPARRWQDARVRGGARGPPRPPRDPPWPCGAGATSWCAGPPSKAKLDPERTERPRAHHFEPPGNAGMGSGDPGRHAGGGLCLEGGRARRQDGRGAAGAPQCPGRGRIHGEPDRPRRAAPGAAPPRAESAGRPPPTARAGGRPSGPACRA